MRVAVSCPNQSSPGAGHILRRGFLGGAAGGLAAAAAGRLLAAGPPASPTDGRPPAAPLISGESAALELQHVV